MPLCYNCDTAPVAIAIDTYAQGSFGYPVDSEYFVRCIRKL